MAAARAWARAEAEGRVLKQGQKTTDVSSPKVGKLITAPRDHFAALYGASKGYVEMARALLRIRRFLPVRRRRPSPSHRRG
jgi:hypothetical protein